MDLSIDDYADYDIIVTKKERLRGEPTIPLAHALHVADDQAEAELEYRQAMLRGSYGRTL